MIMTTYHDFGWVSGRFARFVPPEPVISRVRTMGRLGNGHADPARPPHVDLVLGGAGGRAEAEPAVDAVLEGDQRGQAAPPGHGIVQADPHHPAEQATPPVVWDDADVGDSLGWDDGAAGNGDLQVQAAQRAYAALCAEGTQGSARTGDFLEERHRPVRGGHQVAGIEDNRPVTEFAVRDRPDVYVAGIPP